MRTNQTNHIYNTESSVDEIAFVCFRRKGAAFVAFGDETVSHLNLSISSPSRTRNKTGTLNPNPYSLPLERNAVYAVWKKVLRTVQHCCYYQYRGSYAAAVDSFRLMICSLARSFFRSFREWLGVGIGRKFTGKIYARRPLLFASKICKILQNFARFCKFLQDPANKIP